MARRVKKPKKAFTQQAMDQLVKQFAQPLAFLRELVQNSLDASTEQIEVDLGYDEESQSCWIRVRDYGVGMDRHIIDTKLTRLFSSTKEDDLTKIGKFGIGFVSIFAISPQLVVLETGRDGESWRLLFKPDRSFERRRLETPREGTSVTVFVNRRASELSRLREDCRQTLAYWCRHAEVEILFEGVPINEPFELPEAPWSHHHKIEGTEVVVGPSAKELAFRGYYNRGLTLLEDERSQLPYVSYKLRSRFLEHTLSRDNVMIDEGYWKALEEVKTAAYRGLPVSLAERLSRGADEELWDLAAVIATHYPEPAPQLLAAVPLFPSGERRLARRELPERALIHPQVDVFWKAVEATGAILVEASPCDPRVRLLEALGCQPTRLVEEYLHFETRTELTAAEESLLSDLRSSMRALRSLTLVRVLSRPSSEKGRLCRYLALETGVRSVREATRRGDSVGLFDDHPFWSRLLSLHAVVPEFAIAVGVRHVALELGLGYRDEARLVGKLAEQLTARWGSSS